MQTANDAQSAALSLNGSNLLMWRIVQFAVWTIGAAIVAALMFSPTLGLHAFWNVLIPVAPALVALAPGLWRNICPLASTALFPRHMRRSRRVAVPQHWHGAFALFGIVTLLLLVPLRHVVLDLDGPATAMVILSLAATAIAAGLIFEWKSGWCSGLCPVHPVEKLYGQRPAVSPPNAHCTTCQRCTKPCPDSIPNPLLATPRTRAHRVSQTLMIGGFAGFVWGWFQVPDYAGATSWNDFAVAYGFPFAGMIATLALYVALRRNLGERHQDTLVRVFAAGAIIIYYWYRLPALVGFGLFPGDGMLVDLRGVASLSPWLPWVMRSATTGFFAYWFLRPDYERVWAPRPSFAA